MGRHWHKRKAKEEENIFTERLSLLRLPKVGIIDSATKEKSDQRKILIVQCMK